MSAVLNKLHGHCTILLLILQHASRVYDGCYDLHWHRLVCSPPSVFCTHTQPHLGKRWCFDTDRVAWPPCNARCQTIVLDQVRRHVVGIILRRTAIREQLCGDRSTRVCNMTCASRTPSFAPLRLSYGNIPRFFLVTSRPAHQRLTFVGCRLEKVGPLDTRENRSRRKNTVFKGSTFRMKAVEKGSAGALRPRGLREGAKHAPSSRCVSKRDQEARSENEVDGKGTRKGEEKGEVAKAKKKENENKKDK